MTTLHVLVVEDQPHTRAWLCYILRRAGHVVSEADGGKAALLAVEKSRFDLVLCDLTMPGMSGMDVVRALCANPQAHDMVIVSVTMDDSPGMRRKVLAAGFDEYYCKPVDDVTIVAELERLVQRLT